jgi:hypothetical protein
MTLVAATVVITTAAVVGALAGLGWVPFTRRSTDPKDQP